MIPKILHFCFGLSSKGGDWGLVHYACVKSAVERLKPEQAFLYFEHVPRGPFWDLTTKLIKCEHITAPRSVFGNPLLHYAHRADVIRLEKLIEMGGIYLDCDVLVHRDFDGLLDNSVVLGQEGENRTLGLCNAVILAEPGAPFLKRWYLEYKSFRSKGHDQFWGEHSVERPLRLAKAYGEEVMILGPRAFFWPTWEEAGLKRMFASTEPIPSEGVYANHLWESWAWPDYLRDLTPARVRLVDSNFHSWVRPLIADLPDHFGARSSATRVMTYAAEDDLLSHARVKRRQEKASRRQEKIRWIAKKLRSHCSPLDKALRNRRMYIDKIVATIAVLAARGFRSQCNFIASAHRRRTFQSVYRDHLWGDDGNSAFFSGVGSRGNHAQSYVKAMVPLLARHAIEAREDLVIVDLGCGDFAIGSALITSLKRVRYVGCDIVPELVAYNRGKFESENIKFQILDIVNDVLPDGDVCLLRQVLQHLSNSEISAVLPKLANYKYVYVSEGQPLIHEGIPNPDKAVGAEVRFDWRTGRGRGVELDLPPWNLELQEVTRTNSTGSANESVVTYRISGLRVCDISAHARTSKPPERPCSSGKQ
jgi:hypothetical protein